MYDMKYSDYISHVRQENFKGARQQRILANLIENLITESDIIEFYPKNLFNDEKELEVYIFKANSVHVFKNAEDEVTVQVLKYEQITHLELHHEKDYTAPDIELRVGFSNGEIITLCGNTDTNPAWSEKFTDTSIRVFKMLS